MNLIKIFRYNRKAVVLPTFHIMRNFTNTLAGNNLYAACSLTGDFEPYRQAKKAWNRHTRRLQKKAVKA